MEKSGLSNWDVHLSEKSFEHVFVVGDANETAAADATTSTTIGEKKSKIVYLTSDSPNELDRFDDEHVYIIGGLVDHNHHKCLCYDLAVKNGWSHARLPIGKFMSMKTRSVLTVNQVFQIVCKFVECHDWRKAFTSALPKRKGAEELSDDNDNDHNNEPNETASQN